METVCCINRKACPIHWIITNPCHFMGPPAPSPIDSVVRYLLCPYPRHPPFQHLRMQVFRSLLSILHPFLQNFEPLVCRNHPEFIWLDCPSLPEFVQRLEGLVRSFFITCRIGGV